MTDFSNTPQQGLSLVEVLLALAIGAMLLAPLVSLFQSAADGARVRHEQTELQAQARFAVQRIAAQVQNSTPAALPATPDDTGPTALKVRYLVRTDAGPGRLVETDKNATLASDTLLAVPVASLSVTSSEPGDGARLVTIAVTMAGSDTNPTASETVRMGSLIP